MGLKKIKTKRRMRVIFASFGIAAAVFMIIGGLAWIVVKDNEEECSKIKLGGSLGVMGFHECAISNKYKYDEIYVIVGNTANVPAPQVGEELKRYFSNSLVDSQSDKRAEIRAMSVVSGGTVMPLRINKDDADDQDAASVVARVNKAIGNIESAIITPPTANGADYLGAIKSAAKRLKTRIENGGRALIVLMGSGLSDDGDLDFAHNNLLTGGLTSDDIVRAAVSSRKISDDLLKGIDIVWQDIGMTAAPQDELEAGDIDTLKEIYEGILIEAGAKRVVFIDNNKDPIAMPELNGFTVGTTPVHKTQIKFEPVSFSETELNFMPQEASFSDGGAKAESALKETASVIRNEGDVRVTVVGYTAHYPCSAKEPTELGGKRARVVRDILIQLGANADRISYENGGWGTNGKDCDDNGNFNEAEAKKNRIVIVREKER